MWVSFHGCYGLKFLHCFHILWSGICLDWAEGFDFSSLPFFSLCCLPRCDGWCNKPHAFKKNIKVSRVLYWPQIKCFFFFLKSSTGGNFLNSKAAVATKGNIPHKDTGHSGPLKLYLLHIFKEVTGRLRCHTPFKCNSGEFKHLTCSCRMWTPPSWRIFPQVSPSVFLLSSLCPRIQSTNGYRAG